jgi:pimeloyl-ACP methyl ester carboxylesterase
MAVAAMACLLVAAILVAMPPSVGTVPQFTDADGNVLPGSIAEKTWVDVDGARIGMVIEGQDASNPVLLVLGGGPGIPEYWMEHEWACGLDQHFTVCWMDWRGAGLSYDANLDPSTCTTERYVDDVVAVTDYLRDRFGQDRVYLMGHSFGTYMALQVLRDHSDPYAAYVGMSQITSGSREKVGYERMLQLCQQTGNRSLQQSLERYRDAIDTPDGTLDMGDPLVQRYFSHVRDEAMHSLGVGTRHDMSSVITGIFLPTLRATCYTIPERIGIWRGKAALVGSPVSDDALTFDAGDFTSFDVPVYVLAGVHDETCDYGLQREWFDAVEAPTKGFYTFDDSAHSPLFEEPDKAVGIMAGDVLSGANDEADGR